MEPTFFIIGAAKSGTTSLHHYLDEHPDISMSSPKEPSVLAEPTRTQRRVDWGGLFEPGPTHRGDSSTTYSRFPLEGNAAANIAERVPAAKVVYLVRDPIERILSDYVHHVASGLEPNSLAAAVRDVEDPANFYISASRYGTQLENYLNYVDRDQILILEQASLDSRRLETLQSVLRFIGADSGFVPRHLDLEYLTRRELRDTRVLEALRASPMRRPWRRLPMRLRVYLTRRAFRRAELPRPELQPELRAALEAHLTPEIDLLRQLSGLPLESLDPSPTGS
jgi:hypothetical protein